MKQELYSNTLIHLLIGILFLKIKQALYFLHFSPPHLEKIYLHLSGSVEKKHCMFTQVIVVPLHRVLAHLGLPLLVVQHLVLLGPVRTQLDHHHQVPLPVVLLNRANYVCALFLVNILIFTIDKKKNCVFLRDVVS